MIAQTKFKLLLIICLTIIGLIIFSSLPKQPSPPPAVFASKLSSDEYSNTKEYYFNLVNTADPRAAIDKLKVDMATNQKLAGSCHELLHEMGRISFQKYQDFSQTLTYQDEICVSGYIHGVIEEYFSNSEDIFKSLEEVCSAYPKDNHLRWECFHGVGHGLMYYSSNNLNFSLNSCDKYKDEFARNACSNGVFMENFNTDQKLHPSEFIKAEDPLYPCNTQIVHKADCYGNAPIYILSQSNYDFQKAFKVCDGAEIGFKTNCYSGIGAQAVRRNIQNIKSVEELCESGGKNRVSGCLDGLVSMYISYFWSIEKAQAMCSELKEDNRRFCNNLVTSYESLLSVN